MTEPLRIAIADDHALFRQGLRSMLNFEDAFTVVAEVNRASDLPALLEQTSFDVLLLDLQMERSSLADIEALSGRVAVIVVTASERPDDALAALRAGARAVVFKRFAIETLMTAIRAVVDGHAWMPPALQSQLADQLRVPAPQKLTPREREIVQHVARGLRNAEVAKSLFISEVTVKTHLNNVFQKLGLRDRVGLTLYAIRTGIIGSHEGRF
jgi:two-component system, NarL family, response regulator